MENKLAMQITIKALQKQIDESTLLIQKMEMAYYTEAAISKVKTVQDANRLDLINLMTEYQIKYS